MKLWRRYENGGRKMKLGKERNETEGRRGNWGKEMKLREK